MYGRSYQKKKRIKDETLPARIQKCIKVFEKENNYKLKEVAKSFLTQYTSHKGLTSSQISYLESWEKKIDDPDAKCWEKEYRSDKEKQDLFKEAVGYFTDNGPYYDKQCAAHNSNPEYCPPELTYQRMTDNKYFQRYLKEKKSVSKFKSGDLVLGRSNDYAICGSLYIVLGETGKVDPCKGGKWYKVYCLTSTNKYHWRAGAKPHCTSEHREKSIKHYRRKK